MDEIKLPADAADRKIFARTAPAYWAAGLSVIPIRKGDKRPALPAKNDAKGYPAWTEYCRRLPEVEDRESWLKAYDDCGLGLALGPASGVVVIDVDTVDPDQIAAIERVLPPSPWRRVGSKGWAAAYRYGGVKSFKIKDNNEATVVEHLAEGNQVVLPPSIHPKTGRPYTANSDLLAVLGELQELPADIEARLRAALGFGRGAQRSRVKAAPAERDGLVVGAEAVEFFGIRLPARCGAGGRDDTCTKVCGALAAGVVSGRWNLWSAEAALEAWFAAAVEQPLGDELPWDKWPVLLWKFVAASADEAGGRAGFGWREGLTDHELIVRGLAHVADGDPVGWIARNYIYVAREDAFVEKERGTACHSAEFMRLHQDRLEKPWCWKDAAAARAYVIERARAEGHELVKVQYAALRPEMAPGLARDEAGRQFWNLWRGFTVKPRDGDAGPWEGLLKAMFPVGWERETFCDWLAYLVQRPGERMSWATVLISETKGTGKGTIGGVLLKLFGDAGGTVSNAALSGRFTGWLVNKCFIFVDETYGPDRVEVREKLKTWIAGPEMFGHEAKGRDIVQVAQRASFLIASNHEDFLPLEHDDRRWFVPEVADKAMSEAEWTRFHSWLEGNLGVVLHWLLSRSIPASFNAKGRAPVTEKFLRIGRQGATMAGKYVAWGIEEGRGPFGRNVVTLDAAIEFLGRYGVKVTSPDGLGKEMARLGCQKVGRYRVGAARTYVWSVRDHGRWVGASGEEVRAELARVVSTAEVETAEASASLAARLEPGVSLH